MRPTPCGQTVCNIHHFRNQNWVSQDKASRRVLFYAFRIFWSCIGWPGVFVHNASASFAVALPICPAGMAGQSGRTSSTFKFCRVNVCRGLKCATVNCSLSVYPGLCSHLRTKDSQLTSAREELMDLRFDVELRAASLCRSQATLGTEQLNCKWHPLPCTT